MKNYYVRKAKHWTREAKIKSFVAQAHKVAFIERVSEGNLLLLQTISRTCSYANVYDWNPSTIRRSHSDAFHEIVFIFHSLFNQTNVRNHKDKWQQWGKVFLIRLRNGLICLWQILHNSPRSPCPQFRRQFRRRSLSRSRRKRQTNVSDYGFRVSATNPPTNVYFIYSTHTRKLLPFLTSVFPKNSRSDYTEKKFSRTRGKRKLIHEH